jgi:flagellar export protein FliJ
MKGLPSLVRLHRWQLEEERKVLARLLAARHELESQIKTVRSDVARERKNATENLEWSFAFPPYADAAQFRVEQINKKIDELDGSIGEAEERVSAAFKELKKYETALENQLERERLEAERKEQIVLDEIALNAHRRKAG